MDVMLKDQNYSNLKGKPNPLPKPKPRPKPKPSAPGATSNVSATGAAGDACTGSAARAISAILSMCSAAAWKSPSLLAEIAATAAEAFLTSPPGASNSIASACPSTCTRKCCVLNLNEVEHKMKSFVAGQYQEGYLHDG